MDHTKEPHSAPEQTATQPAEPTRPESADNPFRAVRLKIHTGLRAGGRRGNLSQDYPAEESG